MADNKEARALAEQVRRLGRGYRDGVAWPARQDFYVAVARLEAMAAHPLRAPQVTATAALSELRAEVERLRAKAERYDWLRSGKVTRNGVDLAIIARSIDESQFRSKLVFHCWAQPEEMDSIIDSARSAASGESAEGGV